MTLQSQIGERLLDYDRDSPIPTIAADLNYLIPITEKPFNYLYEPPPGIQRQNVEFDSHRVTIHDGRSLSSNLSLDREGFAFVAQASTVRDFFNQDEIYRTYYPEAEQLVKAVFDHNLRNAERARQGVEGVKEPVKRVHNDFTAKSGYRRSQDELIRLGIDNADALLRQRFSIINVWRPIAHPVEESPLAVCSASSIAPVDWVASDLIYRDRVGETYLTTYNPSHQWFYFPQMQPDEVLLIKCFDTSETIPARFTAHTAFDDPTSPPNAKSRASIELRLLVFYGET
jgi:hypothetical protein